MKMANVKKKEESAYKILGGLDNKVVTLKSVYHKDRKAVIQPRKDAKTRWYLGIPRFSDEEKRGMDFWTEPSSKLTLENNTTFDLNDEHDRKNWAWVQHTSVVALSFEECQKTKTALFYVDNEDLEAQKTLDSDDLMLSALNLIKNDRDDALSGRLRLLGFDSEGESPVVLRKSLNKYAKDPKTVRKLIDVYKSPSAAIELLFMKAVDKDVITQTNGIFIFGKSPLGATKEASVRTLIESGNSEIVKLIEKEVSEVQE